MGLPPIPSHPYTHPQDKTVTTKPFALAGSAVTPSTKKKGVLVPLKLCLHKETVSYLQRAVAHGLSYCSTVSLSSSHSSPGTYLLRSQKQHSPLFNKEVGNCPYSPDSRGWRFKQSSQTRYETTTGSTAMSAGRIAHAWYPSTGADRSLDPHYNKHTGINTQPETPHARKTLSSNLLHETSGPRPSCSADHNGGLTCAEGSGDQLCPALPNGQDGKKREKRRKTHPTLPREWRRPAPCPEVTPSCLALALLCTSTSLAVLCAWPSCFCAEPCCHAWVPSCTREGPLRGERPCTLSRPPGQGPHAAGTDPPPSITSGGWWWVS